MKKLYLLLLFSVMFIGVVNAVNECGNERDFQGYVKQGNGFVFSQTCDTCTYVNLSSVTLPNSTSWVYNLAMTKNGIEFNRSSAAADTTVLGCHSYTVYGDKDGGFQTETFDYKVTPQGWASTWQFYIIFLIIIVLTFLVGFKLQNNWIMFFGSTFVFLLGFFIIFNGIDVIKDTTTTRAIGFVVWGIAAIFLFLSMEEMLKN